MTEKNIDGRPEFPKRAVVTAGMPYGNKELHFGHIGGVFVHADAYARFLRDRIGAENVIFVSGTDCYGSPIVEKYRRLREEGYTGSIEDFVLENHEKQKKTLSDYDISLCFYGASAFSEGGAQHDAYSAEFFDALFKTGHVKLLKTMQFYDPKAKVFLNGRQVTGRCPINGCKSEEAYADECSLGHQYFPHELIAPASAITGETPELREVSNWYFDLESFREPLSKWVEERRASGEMREFAAAAANEFLKEPAVHLKIQDAETAVELAGKAGGVERDEKAGKALAQFETLKEREEFCEKLSARGIKYRTGKTLVPFRLTGNIEWGVKVPERDGVKGLTFWVWPESLWAPVSFTKACLKLGGLPPEDWKKYWSGDGAKVYQFIGEDNIYFYGLAEIAMFMALRGESAGGAEAAKKTEHGKSAGHPYIGLPAIIPNKHIMFFNKKASSSGKVKPPMAHELLDYYTAEQLRAHFLGLGLGQDNAPFQPKPLNPDFPKNQGDPVLKEGVMFTNVLNRALRTLFYTAQKYTSGALPDVMPGKAFFDAAEAALLKYERLMSRFEFHAVMNHLDDFYRSINRGFSAELKTLQERETAGETGAITEIARCLSNYAHLLKAAVLMAHPVCPGGAETAREYFNADERFFSWAHAFEPLQALVKKNHPFKFLEPRVDFFKKHPSQLIE